MLKTIRSPDVSGHEVRNSDDEVAGFDIGSGSEELAKKSGKSKDQNLSKSQKSAELRKSLPKSGNLSNFGTIKAEPDFLTPDTREIFNRLWLAFTKALILWHFDKKCHISIKTDALGYAIGGVLSQLASGIRPDGVVTKTDLSQ